MKSIAPTTSIQGGPGPADRVPEDHGPGDRVPGDHVPGAPDIARVHLVRTVLPLKGLGVLDWLVKILRVAPDDEPDWAAGRRQAAFYWSSRDGQEEAAGLGQAAAVDENTHSGVGEALAWIGSHLSRSTDDLRFYGGLCFDPGDRRASRSSFGRFRFFAPRLEIRRRGEAIELAAVGQVACGGDPAEIASRLNQWLKGVRSSLQKDWAGDVSGDRVALGRVVESSDVPDRAGWCSMVEDAQESIRAGAMGKIVLSRQRRLRLGGAVDVGELLARLRAGGQRAYGFCFQFGGHAFLGNSPECLYRREGRRIFTEAIAGTCAVSEADRETRDLLDKLLASAKEAEEHGFVFDHLHQELGRICARFEVLSRREVLRLRHVQHMVSRFAGVLKPDLTAGAIIEALHPTAAVGGFPKQAAMERIRELEPHVRGWYAGPVGWLGRDTEEFAVGIRSCHIEGDRLALVAGAGIVRASDPEAEWAETEVKMRQFLDALR
ncbi:MAG: isochorismate synthase [Phycisphaeraceae bacterium]|nr:isochorismate synthase [Phycisphaeraceae bacterium]